MAFCHLHVHSHYSLLEGLGNPERLLKRAKQLGQSAMALTDSGNLYGAIEFYKTAKSLDLHPIIGVEFYMALDKRTDRRPKIDSKTHRLVLLAKNRTGYENLIQLVTRAHLEGFYFRPRVDWELLEEYGKGLIALTGDMNGIVSHYLLAGMPEEAQASLTRLQNCYGKENIFLELVDHYEIENQNLANSMLVELAKKSGIPLIVSNNVRYATKEEQSAFDVLLCIKDNRLLNDPHRFRVTADLSMKSEDELKKRWEKIPEVFSNSMAIASQCKLDFKFGKNLIPPFPTPEEKTATTYLKELVLEGLIERFSLPIKKQTILEEKLPKSTSPEILVLIDRVHYELSTINAMGFDEYFLIVWDFIRWAKEKGIFVGPGRGSVAGSLISYCLHITDLNPLLYNLVFERFLNPARISMPDIDIDFADDRRDEILDYVKEKYGKDKVAQVITFGTLAAKAAVKDVGRVYGIPFQEMNQLTKLIPARPGTKLRSALEEEPELKAEYQNNPTFQKIYDTALMLEGTVRQAGVHACAVIISKDPLKKHCPIQKAPGDDDSLITQYSMKPLEDLGLLKMDFLGLRNLTIIEKTLAIIHRHHAKTLNLLKLPMDDKKTFQLLSDGKTTGVFQLESAGMKRYLKDLKPTSFEDIIAMGALYRPGPMQFIPDYIAGKHGLRKVKYVHDDLKPILEKTYGIAVYQEQILQIAQKFAGFTLGEADLLRRAIGKKIAKELKAQREKFISGAIKQAYAKTLATEIFDQVIEPFSNYGFNKSHAACYAMISYQTAYLKAHYPAEFMASLLTCDQENTDRVIIDISECESMGIKILPPEINESYRGFTVIDDRTIRYGLSAIKNLGEDAIETITMLRKESGPFQSLSDFLTRMPPKCLNKKSLEALIKSGSLDRFAERNGLMNSIDLLLEFSKAHDHGKKMNQTDLFSVMEGGEEHQALTIKKAAIASWFQKLQWEKEILGMYVSDHPLRGLREYLKRKMTLVKDITPGMNKTNIRIGGIVNDQKKIVTKRGETMMVLELEDLTGKINVVIFPRVYEQIKDSDLFDKEEYLILVEGRMDYRDGELQCIARTLSKASIKSMRENAMQEGYFNPNETRFTATEMTAELPESIDPPPTIATVQTQNNWQQFRLHDRVKIEDLKTIREILERHPGEHPVVLNVLLEGHRQTIETGIRAKIDDPDLKKELSPFIVEMSSQH